MFDIASVDHAGIKARDRVQRRNTTLSQYRSSPRTCHLRTAIEGLNQSETDTITRHARKTLYRLNSAIGSARCKAPGDRQWSVTLQRSSVTGPSARYGNPRASRTKSWNCQPFPGTRSSGALLWCRGRRHFAIASGRARG